MYGEDASFWAHWILSFHIHPRYLGQSRFLAHLASCIPPAPQQLPCGLRVSPGLQFWETSFTFGGQKLLMAMTFLVYWYGRRYFHFTDWAQVSCIVGRFFTTWTTREAQFSSTLSIYWYFFSFPILMLCYRLAFMTKTNRGKCPVC